MNMYDREKKLISKIKRILRFDVDPYYLDKKDLDRDEARLMEAGADHMVLIGTDPMGYTILILRKGWIVERDIDLLFFFGMRSKVYIYWPKPKCVSEPKLATPYKALFCMCMEIDEMGFDLIIKRARCKLINKS